MALKIIFANTDEERKAAYNIRYKVFVEEAKAFPAESYSNEYEKDEFDDYSQHVIAVIDSNVVGTVRVQTKTEPFIDNENFLYGLAGERFFDYSCFHEKKVKLAEFARSSVLPEYRHRSVIMNLWKAAYYYCMHSGLDALVGLAAPNTSTNCLKDAMIIYNLAMQRNLIHPEFILNTRTNGKKPSGPIIPLYSIEEKKRPEELKLPYNIRMYTNLGLSICGKPVLIPTIDKIAIPMTMKLDELPKKVHRVFMKLNDPVVYNWRVPLFQNGANSLFAVNSSALF